MLTSPKQPGVLLLMSSWYKKAELARRFAIFYSSSLLSGAVGGLLGMSCPHGVYSWTRLTECWSRLDYRPYAKPGQSTGLAVAFSEYVETLSLVLQC